jgi:hypothetical protein
VGQRGGINEDAAATLATERQSDAADGRDARTPHGARRVDLPQTNGRRRHEMMQRARAQFAQPPLSCVPTTTQQTSAGAD